MLYSKIMLKVSKVRTTCLRRSPGMNGLIKLVPLWTAYCKSVIIHVFDVWSDRA